MRFLNVVDIYLDDDVSIFVCKLDCISYKINYYLNESAPISPNLIDFSEVFWVVYFYSDVYTTSMDWEKVHLNGLI